MDIMIDLETYANTPNSAIVQIGAVEFDPSTGEILREFKCNVDAQSCIDLGMEANIDTINWWMRQSDEARQSILNEGRDIISVLRGFRSFIVEGVTGTTVKDYFDKRLVEVGITSDTFRDVRMWCHATFDEPILSNAYSKIGLFEPWDYKNVRDIRTLIDLADIDPHSYDNSGTHHDALDDCKFQVRYTVDALNKLKGVK